MSSPSQLLKKQSTQFPSFKLELPQELSQQFISLDPNRKVQIKVQPTNRKVYSTNPATTNKENSLAPVGSSTTNNPPALNTINSSNSQHVSSFQNIGLLQEFCEQVNTQLWHNGSNQDKYQALKTIIKHNRKVFQELGVHSTQSSTNSTTRLSASSLTLGNLSNNLSSPNFILRKQPSLRSPLASNIYNTNSKKAQFPAFKKVVRSRVIIKAKLQEQEFLQKNSQINNNTSLTGDNQQNGNFLTSKVSERLSQRARMQRNSSLIGAKLIDFLGQLKYAPRVYLDNKEEFSYEPGFRQNGMIVAAVDRILALGGHYSQSKDQGSIKVCELDLSMPNAVPKSWTQINADDPPMSRYGFSINAIDHKIYLFGGCVWHKSNLRSSMSNQLYCYNISLKQWSNVKRIGKTPRPCRYHASSVDFGNILVHGGIGEQSSSDYLTTLSIFDSKTKCWESYQGCVPQQLQGGIAYHSIYPLFQSCVGTTYQKFMRQGIYLFGGKTVDGVVNQNMYMARIDPHSINSGARKYKVEEWVRLKTEGRGPSGAYRCNLVFVPQYNGMFVIGGYNRYEICVKQLFMLRLDTLRWERIQCLDRVDQSSMNSNFHCHSAAYHKGKVYIFGGFDQYTGYGKTRVLYLDRKDESWEGMMPSVKSKMNVAGSTTRALEASKNKNVEQARRR